MEIKYYWSEGIFGYAGVIDVLGTISAEIIKDLHNNGLLPIGATEKNMAESLNCTVLAYLAGEKDEFKNKILQKCKMNHTDALKQFEPKSIFT